MVVHESEQHDVLQYVRDFFEYYGISFDSLNMVANEVLKRLPAAVLKIPVSMASRRQVSIGFSASDNITKVVEGFLNYFELEDAYKVQILRIARSGMAPGSFLV